MKERLQKLIARAGIASRRKAEELILQGQVTVNGRTVTELGSRADPREDHIKVGSRVLRPEPYEYYAVHKPRGVLSAASDASGRSVVTQIVPSQARLYPAGRLDFNSEGLVILTNDGDLAMRLMKAGGIEKTYQVKVHKVPDPDQLATLQQGMVLEGERLAPCRIRLIKPGNNPWYEVQLKQGRKRQIRRMFERVGHPVARLRRISVGPVKLGKLPPAAFRRLTEAEIRLLKG